MIPKFEEFRKTILIFEDESFADANPNASSVAGQGANTPQIYSIQPEKPSMLRELFTEAIKMRFMSKIISSNVGNAIVTGATVGGASVAGGAVAKTGIMATIGPAVTGALTNPIGWVTLGVVATSVGAYYYLKGNEDMYEIGEVWKTKKHSKNTTKQTKTIYNLMASALYKASSIGYISTNTILEKYKGIIRPVDINKENIKDYDNLLVSLGDVRDKIVRYTDLPDVGIWYKIVTEGYDGLPVSGSRKLDDYTAMKSFVVKYMLENDDSDKNPYGVELAEEAEGWFSTMFDNFIPGMTELGYSAYLLSEEYFNSLNKSGYLKTRQNLKNLMASQWVMNVVDMSDSNINSEDFVRILKSLSGNSSKITLKDINILSVVTVSGEGDNIKYTKVLTIEQLIKEIAKNIRQEFEKNLDGADEILPYTNVVFAFALRCAFVSVIEAIITQGISFAHQYKMFSEQAENIKKDQEAYHNLQKTEFEDANKAIEHFQNIQNLKEFRG